MESRTLRQACCTAGTTYRCEVFGNLGVVKGLSLAPFGRVVAGGCGLLLIQERGSFRRNYRVGKGNLLRWRALVPHPQLLLLDEPFSALDTTLRQELADLQNRLDIPMVLITHGPNTVAMFRDQVVSLREGIVQPDDAFNTLSPSRQESRSTP